MSSLKSSFEEVFDSTFEKDDNQDDENPDHGARLTRKKSGVVVKEKGGMKKKPSMRELKQRKNSRAQSKTPMKSMINLDIPLPKKKSPEELALEEEKNKRIRVISARIDAHDNEKRFEGKWESEEASFDGFLDELSVGRSFMKLAAKFGGTQVQKLYIKQEGEYFEIVETNDRRDVFMALQINEKFMSKSERGEELECIANWEDSETKEELIIEFYNTETEEKSLVRRSVSEDRLQLFEIKEDGNGKELKRRTYHRR